MLDERMHSLEKDCYGANPRGENYEWRRRGPRASPPMSAAAHPLNSTSTRSQRFVLTFLIPWSCSAPNQLKLQH